ncbi:MAG: hypothetical protein VCE43_04315 [Myxococcota bacterium]
MEDRRSPWSPRNHSRLRPVPTAAPTTTLGMIPLVADDFFHAMVVTIISGLTPLCRP